MHFFADVLGATAFGLYYLYDYCLVRHSGFRFARWLFPIASILVVFATLLNVLTCGITVEPLGKFLFWLICCVVFSILLIYSLFFSLPKGTYLKPGEPRGVYDQGLYALCRHPGFLMFCLFYFCLGMLLGKESWQHFALLCFLNFIYIVMQDRWSFPKLFYDYTEYVKRVPFIIPSKKSILRCITLIKK